MRRKSIARNSKKRGNGEGTVYRRKDGLWAAEWTAQTFSGPKRKTVYGKTQGEVIQKRKEQVAQERAGFAFDAGKTAVEEYLSGWLEESVKDSIKPGTYENYSQATHKHLIPALGQIKLKNLTPDHVRRLRRSKLEEEYSTRTVRLLIFVLRKALQQAVEDGLVPRNVAQGVRVSQTGKEEIRPLSSGEAKRFLAAASGDRLETLYVLALHTGLRQGELLGLKWEDIDLEARKLSVRRTLVRAKGGRPVFGTPKTAKSRRSIKLTARAVEALEIHRTSQERERTEMGPLWPDNGLVFRSTTGTPLDRHNLCTRSFKRLLENAGIPTEHRFHDLRHTCATILLSKGKHPKYVQALLGHATVAITLDTYSHVLPGMDDGLADAMDDALS